METRDVVIVGGGPAGSACAGRLQAAGLEVLVLDRASFPRDKVCAGWVVPDVFRLAGLSALDYGLDATLQDMSGARIGVIGGTDVAVEHDVPVSYGIRRRELDHRLLVHSGAPFRTRQPVERVERVNGHWVLDGVYRARILVGAGGSFCPVARQLNPRPEPSEVVVASEIEVRLDARQASACQVEPERPEIHFCPDLRGYGWCFRKGDYLNVGLGRRGDPASLRSHLRGYVDWQVARRRIPADLPSRFRGHAYALYGGGTRRLVGDGVLLIGDAAGVAGASSGEGIRPAMESGLLAAGAILAAAGRVGREDLAAYEDALEAQMGPRRPLGAPGSLVAWAVPHLLRWPYLARTLVLDHQFLGRDRRPLLVPALEPPAARRAA